MLYTVVRDHFETFRAEAAQLRNGEGLPRFVEEEFEPRGGASARGEPPPAGSRRACGLLDPREDGTTSVVFEPTAFLERLAVLVPRPRVNLVLYHSVLASVAASEGHTRADFAPSW